MSLFHININGKLYPLARSSGNTGSRITRLRGHRIRRDRHSSTRTITNPFATSLDNVGHIFLHFTRCSFIIPDGITPVSRLVRNLRHWKQTFRCSLGSWSFRKRKPLLASARGFERLAFAQCLCCATGWHFGTPFG